MAKGVRRQILIRGIQILSVVMILYLDVEFLLQPTGENQVMFFLAAPVWSGPFAGISPSETDKYFFAPFVCGTINWVMMNVIVWVVYGHHYLH